MQKQMMRLLLLLTICLSGCGHIMDIPERKDHERCVVKIDLNGCFCHLYRISPEMVGRVPESKTVKKPLEYCQDLIGNKPSVWVETVLWIEEFFQSAEDTNNMSKEPGNGANNILKEPIDFEKPMIETPEEIYEIVDERLP